MISQLNNTSVRSAYQSNSSDVREANKKDSATVSKQGDTSKVDQIKEALEAGEYKIDLQALSEKIADELL